MLPQLDGVDAVGSLISGLFHDAKRAAGIPLSQQLEVVVRAGPAAASIFVQLTATVCLSGYGDERLRARVEPTAAPNMALYQ